MAMAEQVPTPVVSHLVKIAEHSALLKREIEEMTWRATWHADAPYLNPRIPMIQALKHCRMLLAELKSLDYDLQGNNR